VSVERSRRQWTNVSNTSIHFKATLSKRKC